MKLPRNAKVFRGQLDIAPFVGVFFLLLIFVLLKNHISFVPGVPVQLPAAYDPAGFQGPAMAVTIDDGGRFYFDNQLLKPEELLVRLRQRVQLSELPLTLIVQADWRVRYGTLMQLDMMARDAGIREIVHAVNSIEP